MPVDVPPSISCHFPVLVGAPTHGTQPVFVGALLAARISPAAVLNYGTQPVFVGAKLAARIPVVATALIPGTQPVFVGAKLASRFEP